jgi:hypothetical protein
VRVVAENATLTVERDNAIALKPKLDATIQERDAAVTARAELERKLANLAAQLRDATAARDAANTKAADTQAFLDEEKGKRANAERERDGFRARNAELETELRVLQARRIRQEISLPAPAPPPPVPQPARSDEPLPQFREKALAMIRKAAKLVLIFREKTLGKPTEIISDTKDLIMSEEPIVPFDRLDISEIQKWIREYGQGLAVATSSFYFPLILKMVSLAAVARSYGAEEYDDRFDAKNEHADALRLIRKIMWTPELLAIDILVWKNYLAVNNGLREKSTEEVDQDPVNSVLLAFLYDQEKSSSFVTTATRTRYLRTGFGNNPIKQEVIQRYVAEYWKNRATVNRYIDQDLEKRGTYPLPAAGASTTSLYEIIAGGLSSIMSPRTLAAGAAVGAKSF